MYSFVVYLYVSGSGSFTSAGLRYFILALPEPSINYFSRLSVFGMLLQKHNLIHYFQIVFFTQPTFINHFIILVSSNDIFLHRR